MNEEAIPATNSPLWEHLSGKNLLITGATGMLGINAALAAITANRLYHYDIHLFLLGRNKDKAHALFDKNEVRLLLQDIREPLPKETFHYIFHAAGPVGPNIFHDSPVDVLSSNIEGTLALLRHCAKYGTDGIALASTHEVYGRASGGQTENSHAILPNVMDPRACYVLAKQASENAIANFATQYGIRGMSARLSRLYGLFMNMDSGLFICDFLRQAKTTGTIRIRGGANLLRPLCGVDDAVSAMLHILVNGEKGEAYNVQGEEIPTILDIAKIIADRCHAKVVLDKPETLHLSQEGHWLVVDKLKSLGWRQRVSMINGLDELIEKAVF